MSNFDGCGAALRAVYRVTIGLPKAMIRLLQEIDAVEAGARHLKFRAETPDMDETMRRIVEGLNR
jgi:hypothetical protein